MMAVTALKSKISSEVSSRSEPRVGHLLSWKMDLWWGQSGLGQQLPCCHVWQPTGWYSSTVQDQLVKV
jgi:hypothetical protein